LTPSDHPRTRPQSGLASTGHLQSPVVRAGLGAILCCTALIGCDKAPEPLAKATPGRIPATPQRPGDPRKGYDALLNRAAVTCGIPIAAYRAAQGRAAPGPEPQFPGRNPVNAALPYGLTVHRGADGVELVNANCLLCHAAPFDGALVMGLGNEFLDFTRDPLAAVERAGAFVAGQAEAAQWRRWADRLAAVAPYVQTDTIGANPANNLTLALMAHRDPKTLAWSDQPLIEPPPQRPLPVSVPPWWNMRKKHAMFYNGEGRGDHARYMMLASTTCTDSLAEARELDAWFVDVRAYLATLTPPAYPFAIDRSLATEGEAVFRANCKRCHGSYSDEGGGEAGWTYPNKLVALEDVGTDPALAEAGYRDADRFLRWFAASFYGEGSEAAPGLGYVAPPLDGVWATAPYLHNRSVPTLAALLDSGQRPRYWRHADPPRYDQAAVGWTTVALGAGKAAALTRAERARVYDTDLPGYGHGGHDFGDELSASERHALVEYLKTR
jgi:cytochrome c5